MNFAIIENDKVINVISADSKEIAEQATGLQAVETTGQPWIGWTFDGTDFIAPPVEETPSE
jgi:hypothetical protein